MSNQGRKGFFVVAVFFEVEAYETYDDFVESRQKDIAFSLWLALRKFEDHSAHVAATLSIVPG